MFAALLDTSVLWPSLLRDFLLSLAIERMYRPSWSSAILAELEYAESHKLMDRGEQPDVAATRARHLIGLPPKTWRLPLCGLRSDGRDLLVVDGW